MQRTIPLESIAVAVHQPGIDDSAMIRLRVRIENNELVMHYDAGVRLHEPDGDKLRHVLRAILLGFDPRFARLTDV